MVAREGVDISCTVLVVGQWGGGWIRLTVGFQPLMVISPTASWIRWCMQVYAWWFNVDLSCLGRTICARQFGGATIYTDSEPPSRMPNSLMPSAKLRSANLPVFTSLVWRGRESNRGLPHAPRVEARTTVLRGGVGRWGGCGSLKVPGWWLRLEFESYLTPGYDVYVLSGILKRNTQND